MSANGWGAVLGLALAIGVLLLVSWTRSLRAPRLLERIAPHVPATATTRALASPEPTAAAALMALIVAMARRPSGTDSVRARLQRAGRDDLDRYRLDQLMASALGGAGGAALGLLMIASGGPLVAVLILGGIGAAIGAMAVDWLLTRQARRRVERIRLQLPAVAELLAFSVAAGESPVAALQRVASTVTGDLSDEFQRTIGDIRAGMPLEAALRDVSARTGSPEVERFVDGLVVSMERGTPLAEVMRAQAADARAAERRALMEVAGKKDVAMLVPVVFFILPTVVLIALFPGLQGLRLIVP
jgi:tight adherence protein C